MGFVGPPDEASFDVSVAYFPFRQGWVGGLVDGDNVGPDDEASWQGDSYNKNRLPLEPPVTWDPDGDAQARVELPDGMGPDHGMLFVSSTDPDSSLSLASAHPRDGGWDIAIRQDSDEDPSGTTLNFTGEGNNDADFLFLYVPLAARNLVGGQVNGQDGSLRQQRGDFVLAKSAGKGEFRLTIPGKTETDGMLILSNAGLQPGTTDLADRSFLSYSRHEPAANAGEDGTFVIQAREFLAGNPNNPSTWDWPLRDTDFYFTWVDFANPLSPAAELKAGDADQDFDFDQFDLIQVQQSAKYLTGQLATWGEGDWNGAPELVGDGLFNQLDIIAALSAGTYLTGPHRRGQHRRPRGGRTGFGSSWIPEPSTLVLLSLAPRRALLPGADDDGSPEQMMMGGE